MQIIRFRTPDGTQLIGTPIDGTRTAAVLAPRHRQAPLDGLEPTGDIAEVDRLLAPVEPCNIFCIGLNYRAHAIETGAPIPDNPVVFMKPTTAVTGPGDPIILPAACEHGPEVDYEAELAVVIGRTARNVAAEQALAACVRLQLRLRRLGPALAETGGRQSMDTRQEFRQLLPARARTGDRRRDS